MVFWDKTALAARDRSGCRHGFVVWETVVVVATVLLFGSGSRHTDGVGEIVGNAHDL